MTPSLTGTMIEIPVSRNGTEKSIASDLSGVIVSDAIAMSASPLWIVPIIPFHSLLPYNKSAIADIKKYVKKPASIKRSVITDVMQRQQMRGIGWSVDGICDFVSLCAWPRAKSKTTLAINTKLGTHILHSGTSAYIDPEVKRLKVNCAAGVGILLLYCYILLLSLSVIFSCMFSMFYVFVFIFFFLSLTMDHVSEIKLWWWWWYILTSISLLRFIVHYTSGIDKCLLFLASRYVCMHGGLKSWNSVCGNDVFWVQRKTCQEYLHIRT